MQRDFHYYATAVLARAAGFGEDDALTIAYAAQYVDDAQDGRDILVGGREFSPLATANDFGRYLDSKNRDVWLKVYIPFHFLPPRPITSDKDDFITRPLGQLSLSLLQEVSQENAPDPDYRLIRLGVALHTIADTWAHQGFSGRWSQENDVTKLEALGAPTNLRDAMAKAWRNFTAPIHAANPLQVVHFQAEFWPDYPFLSWRAHFAAPGAGGREHQRDNPTEYLAAAQWVFQTLSGWPKAAPKPTLNWKEVVPKVKQCLAVSDPDREARCVPWREAFAHFFPQHGGLPAYGPTAWEEIALGKPLQQTPFSDLAEALGSRPSYPGRPGFADSPWVKFHRAAAAQRAWLARQVSF